MPCGEHPRSLAGRARFGHSRTISGLLCCLYSGRFRCPERYITAEPLGPWILRLRVLLLTGWSWLPPARDEYEPCGVGSSSSRSRCWTFCPWWLVGKCVYPPYTDDLEPCARDRAFPGERERAACSFFFVFSSRLLSQGGSDPLQIL